MERKYFWELQRQPRRNARFFVVDSVRAKTAEEAAGIFRGIRPTLFERTFRRGFDRGGWGLSYYGKRFGYRIVRAGPVK